MSNHIAYFNETDCELYEFDAICKTTLSRDHVERANDIQKNIPIYDMSQQGIDQSLMAEWARNLHLGSGVIVLKSAYQDTAIIDLATNAYLAILEQERASGLGAGDHFAKAGANGRIWNSLQKLCEYSPSIFARYFSNVAIDAMCKAWLGPAYQMTAQINLVRPGGAAQEAHRDYHLGFMTAAQAEQFPAHIHNLSPALTLQGGIAHVDMPIEAGTTKLLPFSQKYPAGYVGWRKHEFRNYFEENCLQLPLQKGDAIFFNPAVFHAGGHNQTKDVQRVVNLLQVSSAMGRAMETVDRDKICRLVYPELLQDKNKFSSSELNAVIASAAEGYAFPTNLDTDPPVGGLAPKSQADIMRESLEQGKASADFNVALDHYANKRKS